MIGALALLLAAPPSMEAQLAKVAEAHLADPRDAALVLRLFDDTIILRHHSEAAATPVLPGSVMKLFTAYALLEAGKENVRYVCRGHHRDHQGQHRQCWDRSGHGPMRLRTAIAESCNVWFYENSQHLDPRRLARTYAAFGLGHPTVRTRDLPDVAVGDHFSFRTSPLQLLEAVAILASRGARTRLDPRKLELIAEGMKEVAAGGTLAKVLGPGVAAKTGTAKKMGSRGYRGLVVGFLPAESPRYVFVVVKNEGRGAADAGPAAKALVERLR